jgi:hypothetical protein
VFVFNDGTNVSTTGNAATATALQTARTIGGVSFNGTANINLPGVNQAGTQDTTGNAATATKLTTASGSAPSYSARAWVNFNGTGTPAISASGNVSSITDNGTGNYTINFTTALSDTNYNAVSIARKDNDVIDRAVSAIPLLSSIKSTTQSQLIVYVVNSTFDSSDINITFFR